MYIQALTHANTQTYLPMHTLKHTKTHLCGCSPNTLTHNTHTSRVRARPHTHVHTLTHSLLTHSHTHVLQRNLLLKNYAREYKHNTIWQRPQTRLHRNGKQENRGNKATPIIKKQNMRSTIICVLHVLYVSLTHSCTSMATIKHISVTHKATRDSTPWMTPSVTTIPSSKTNKNFSLRDWRSWAICPAPSRPPT